MKKSDVFVILGASENPMRPSYLANKLLQNKGYKTISLSQEQEECSDLQQTTDLEEKTITIFLKPAQQRRYYDYLLALNPSRIIFNPGSENNELMELAAQRNIKVLSGCTIALLVNSMI